MTRYTYETVEVEVSKKEMYAMGWNSDQYTISDYSGRVAKYSGISGRYRLKKYDRMGKVIIFKFKVVVDEYRVDMPGTSKVDMIPCPTCKGYGSYEVHTSHSFDVECENCGGTGKVKYED